MIGVDLGERAVELPVGVNGHHDRDPRAQPTNGAAVDRIHLPPLASGEVDVVQPGLVQVEDTNAFGQLRDHEHGVFLPQYEAAIGVSEEWDLFNALVPRSHLVAKHLAYISPIYV